VMLVTATRKGGAYCPLGLASFGSVAVPVMVTIAVFAVVEFATDLAVTTTVGGSGAVAGAVYFPAASIIPQPAPAQPVPTSSHLSFLWLKGLA
jgi:hypothetical protein